MESSTSSAIVSPHNSKIAKNVSASELQKRSRSNIIVSPLQAPLEENKMRLIGGKGKGDDSHTKQRAAKDRIIEYVSKYIRRKHYPSENDAIQDKGYEETITNLKEFPQ